MRSSHLDSVVSRRLYRRSGSRGRHSRQGTGLRYCGPCNFYGCHVHAKAATLYTTIPVAVETGNFELRTNCKVFRVNVDSAGEVTGVSYFDPEGRVQKQQARVVILSAFVFENIRLLLLSKTDGGCFARGLANSSGSVGRYILAHGDSARDRPF